jgi:hypothetical protein
MVFPNVTNTNVTSKAQTTIANQRPGSAFCATSFPAGDPWESLSAAKA